MPTFDTPEPIFVILDLSVGQVRINASDRSDTVVEVRPSDPLKGSDAEAAEQTRIEYSMGRLMVKAPKNKARSFFGGGASIDVTIDLPSGSRAEGKAAAADFRAKGRLGETKFKVAAGGIRLDRTGTLKLSSASGDISVAGVVGHAEVGTGSGDVRIEEVDGTAVVKNASGDITVGEVTGDLRLNTAQGDITVGRALSTVVAKTAQGSVRIGEVVRGSVVLETGSGGLEVGIRKGTAAWIDARSHAGTVHNSLDAAAGPEGSDETVEVRARTSSGDIVIRRA
ncbi:DUF4097 family beta strand repeat-containing protein [Embleya sp. NBC_00896]|uniref:DUF4097 family beta strand repeat-containing protein n=1 Tax=Embleya sp. NBC_00896 TaxID=2975961 RepID=UPI002F914B33|nr:DUF4097 domain-containing protein [Embleya sp. NBC_00896]